MTVDHHLLDFGATNACLALACVHEHLSDTDLIPVVSGGFADATKTTEELHELIDSYLPAIRSFLWPVWFDLLQYIVGSRMY